jgi:hypothetical protein
MDSSFAGAAPASSSQTDERIESLLAAIQLALHEEDGTRLQALERQLQSFQHQTQSANEALQAAARELQAELDKVRQAARANDNLARDLQIQLEILSHKSQADAAGLVARVTPMMGELVRRTVHDSRDEMAEALGPVMGEAIRVQIRDSRQDMVEALYPVIGSTVQRAISEFARELQRNIDARLKTVVGPRGLLRTFSARLRGVSSSQLMLRDSIPFAMQEAFLIQRGSGLLIAHYRADGTSATDSDLIGGMLTAIREFVQDSFGQGQADRELDEIQYGNQRVIIQSGLATYLAVVISGVEPSGFHARLNDYMAELHTRHGAALRSYTGDSTTLPNLQPTLARLMTVAAEPAAIDLPRPMRREIRLALFGCSTISVLGLGLACFYLQFTLALLPIAFPGPTVTATFTPQPPSTVTPVNTPTPISTVTATSRPTDTPTPTFAATPTKTATSTRTSTPGPTPTPVAALAAGHVWVRPAPDPDAPLLIVLLKDTPVTALAVYDGWLEVEWISPAGLQRGWVPQQWVTLLAPIAPGRITPTATP